MSHRCHTQVALPHLRFRKSTQQYLLGVALSPFSAAVLSNLMYTTRPCTFEILQGRRGSVLKNYRKILIVVWLLVSSCSSSSDTQLTEAVEVKHFLSCLSLGLYLDTRGDLRLERNVL